MTCSREAQEAGLATTDELFAVRLLEFARFLEPEGNRVRFVELCEEHGIRVFLQRFPELWQRITDSPEREGITPNADFLAAQRASGRKGLEFQMEAMECLQRAGIPALAFNGPSLSVAFFAEPLGGRFQEIDLLVSPERALEAVTALSELNLRPGSEQNATPRQRHAWYRFGGAEGMYRDGTSGHLLLHWKPLSPWLGDDILSFETLFEKSREMEFEGMRWRSLGSCHNLLMQLFQAYTLGFRSLHALLDSTLALNHLDCEWSEVLAEAGYRRAMVERGVEMCVKLLGVPNPGPPTHYYASPRQVIREWAGLQRSGELPTFELLKPNLWSCHSSEALRRSLRALSWPSWSEIQAFNLPQGQSGLYRLIALFSNLRRLLLKGR